MEYKLDSWLKTYQTEESISPADWDELPQDCKIRLDNFARDEAVRRADQFAHEGFLDLNRQDAIRQLVDAMAQAWKLPGKKVRRIVEDIYDELPPQPGHEFEKLTTKLFRRRESYAWKEILEELNLDKEVQIVGFIIKSADISLETVVTSSSFVNVMKSTYDHWTLVHPKEAVNEIVESTELSDDKSGNVVISDLLPSIKRRGAMIWANSLNLELEVGIKEADKEDLIRILKRYALIVKREQVETVEEIAVQEVEKEIIEEIPEDVETPEVVVETPEPEVVEELEPEEDVSEEDEPEVVVEETEAIEEEDEVDEIEAGEGEEDFEEELTEEDQEALNELISEEESDEIAEVVDDYDYGDDSTDSIDDEGSETEEAVDDPAEEKLEEDTEDELPTEEEIEPEIVVEEKKEKKKAEKKIKDVFSATPHEDKRDRFSNLRSGELRDRIVKEMYKSDSTLLDVFLAKLSGAPDWNRAKQFIANEFFRCKLDLHSDLGEEFFMQLKESLENRD